jgi:hypothetical protein
VDFYVGLNVQQLITYSAYVILRTRGEYNETVHQLFIDLKEAYNSVRRELLYSTLTEFGIPMKLLMLKLV